MKKNIRLAVVGTGYFSQFHYDAWKRLNVDLVGICSLNKDEASKYSKQFQNCEVFLDFETMIKTTKPELVDIIVPPLNHLKFIKVAARHKVHIICQKPFTTSINEAKEAISFAKRKRVNSQFFTHPDLGVIEAYQYETSPGSNVGGGVFFTMMQNDNNEFGQVQLNQSFFNDAQEGIANRSVKNFEYFDSMNNKHHVISGYEQGGINYVTGIPTSIASTLNYEFFDKKYTANYNVQDVLKEDFLGEDSTYRPFLMKLDDFNLLFQSKTKSDGLFTPLTSGGKSDSFGTSQGDIKSFSDIFASTSNIATKDNFITIGERGL